MNIERYSYVIHISSTVTGELRDNLTCWDAPRAALPVGTVSCAPKVRAMELTDEMEVKMRGPCSGGFGQIPFALRTIVFPTASRFDTMYSYASDSSNAPGVGGAPPDRRRDRCRQQAGRRAAGVPEQGRWPRSRHRSRRVNVPGFLRCVGL
ncbi:hypothetical protein VPH35_019624 [Triticum aestivum]